MMFSQQSELEPLTPSDSRISFLYELEAKKSPYLLTGIKLVVAEGTFIILGVLLGLDMSILDTALVPVTSEFNAVDDIAWISSSYFISQACFVLLYGKVLSFAPPKYVLFVATGIFLLGSLVCGIAPTIDVLLLGRGLAGIGAAGMTVVMLLIITHIATLGQRSLLIALVLSAYAISILVAPVIGGAITERFSFRWCFYLNLPVGGIAMLALTFFIPNVPSSGNTDNKPKSSFLRSWLRMDWIGAFLNVSGVFLLLTGLQWGGNMRPWSDPGVIATVVIGSVLSCLFIVWEARMGSEALLPIVLLKRRNILGSFLSVLFTRWSVIVAALYLSILYQLRGQSVVGAGLQILPTAAASVVGTVLCGFVVGRTRNVWTWMFVLPFLATTAFAVLATVPATRTSMTILAICQILMGFGLGPAYQNSVLIVQTEFVDDEDMIPPVTSLITFSNILSAAVGSSVGGAIFEGTLQSQIDHLHVQLPAKVRTLVLENIEAVLKLPPSYRVPVINAYVVALKRNFFGLIFISAFAGLLVLLIERKRLPKSSSNS